MMMLTTRYLLTLHKLQQYHIERGERIFYAVLLDTTIKFDRLVYIIWDRMQECMRWRVYNVQCSIPDLTQKRTIKCAGLILISYGRVTATRV